MLGIRQRQTRDDLIRIAGVNSHRVDALNVSRKVIIILAISDNDVFQLLETNRRELQQTLSLWRYFKSLFDSLTKVIQVISNPTTLPMLTGKWPNNNWELDLL